MMSEETRTRLSELDREFDSKSVPLVLRPLEALHILAGSEERDGYTGFIAVGPTR
jgi:hypothetical protein